MNKWHETFLDKVIWPTIALVLPNMITFVGSKLQSGNWLTWFRLIPHWVKIAFFGIIGLWLIIILVVRRIRNLREQNLPALPLVLSVPRWGYKTIGTMTHKDVTWRIQISAPAPWDGIVGTETQSSRVRLAPEPYCPKCETELEESKTFFGGYCWSCLNCGFATKNNMDAYREAIRAEKLAQSWWEKSAKNR